LNPGCSELICFLVITTSLILIVSVSGESCPLRLTGIITMEINNNPVIGGNCFNITISSFNDTFRLFSITSFCRKSTKESVWVPALFFPKAENMVLSGRSSDLSRPYEAFPSHVFGTVAGIHKTIITLCVIGHHSSGYCRGFLPHSLFIAAILFRCNTKT